MKNIDITDLLDNTLDSLLIDICGRKCIPLIHIDITAEPYRRRNKSKNNAAVPKYIKDALNGTEGELFKKFLQETSKENSTKSTPPKRIPRSLNYYVGRLAERNNMPIERAWKTIDDMWTMNTAAGMWTILREIAIEIDKKYTDHISDSSEIYTISLINGSIIQVDKDKIRNWSTFPAFRTIQDAKNAKRILGTHMKKLFKWQTRE